MPLIPRHQSNSPAFRLAVLLLFSVSASAGPARAASGDSDAFGYIIRGSDDGGVEYGYEFADNNVPLDEEAFQTVSIGFPFSFYGTEYTALEVHDNGGVSFGLTRALDYGPDCGALDLSAPAIWAHWADMAPTQAASPAGVYYSTLGEAPRRRFVVEWFELPMWNVGGRMSFELKLFEEDGRIEFHYQDVKVDDGTLNDGAAAVVGITTGSDALLYSCTEAALSDGAGGTTFAVTVYPPCEDVDDDGWCPPPGPDESDIDCDDTNSDRYPGAPELCNGIDDDCDGEVPPGENDVDGDGETGCEGDCDDGDASRNSSAQEVCNGVDDDCNDTLPPSERDVDGDGFSPCRGDCDDDDAALNPADRDQDGVDGCSGDCNDDDASILPGSAEQCDGIDNDCNGEVDDNPNCMGVVGGLTEVPYGCLLSCSAADTRGAAGAAVVLLLPVLAARRRRAAA